MMRMKRRRVPGVALLSLVLVVAAVLLGGGWYYSGQIRDGALKVDRSQDPLDLEVATISQDRVTLRLTPETDREGDWRANGTWGLEREDGYDQVGAIIDLTEQSVAREYIPFTGGLRAGDSVRIDSFAFPSDPLQAHGIAFEEVSYSSPLGSFPAWLVEGRGDVWAIFVHGRGANRREALRMLPSVVELAIPSLVITYRNDEGVPQNPDGYYWLGLTEWEDLEGAVKLAMDRGADGFVLVGYSMGGAIVMSFLYRSPFADKVRAVILDAPLLEFGATVDHGASQRSIPLLGLPIPGLITGIGKAFSSFRFGVDFDELDYLSRANELSAPILLFHGDADKGVPVETSDALAEARPDLVRYVRSTDIGHVRTWNVKRADYESAVKEFLLDVVR